MKSYLILLVSLNLPFVVTQATSVSCPRVLENTFPVYKQSTEYTCGPACAMSLLEYFLAHRLNEATLSWLLQTDPEIGTHPENFSQGLRKLGLSAQAREFFTLSSLERSLNEGKQVLALIEEGGDGHWVVIVGANRGEITFMDPYLGLLKTMNSEDFFRIWQVHHFDRWHLQFGIKVFRRNSMRLGPAVKVSPIV